MAQIWIRGEPSMSPKSISKKMWLRVVISSASMVLLTGVLVASVVLLEVSNVSARSTATGQNEMTGEWTASLSNKGEKARHKENDAVTYDPENNDGSGKLHLNFERRSENGGRNQ